MAKPKRKLHVVRRRERKNIERGHAHIQSTFNNTIITLTDVQRKCYYHGQVQDN